MNGEAYKAHIAVVGTGYVGTVVAASLASVGVRTVGLESDHEKLALLQAGQPPFYEPGLDGLLAAATQSGRLRFTSDVADAVSGAAVVFLCVGTPSGADGHADMTAMRAAASAVGSAIRGRTVLVTKSTVPIGSGQWLASLIEDALSPGVDADAFAVVSCPEFLREGSAISDFLHPDRVVLGSDDPAALDVVEGIYRPILDQSFEGGRPSRRPPLVRTSLATAETVKYAANAFLATKVSFINEIANICELVGADVSEVATAIGLDGRIGDRFLDAGLGWGGSCFAKDLRELVATAADYGYGAELLQATIEVNARQRRLVVERLRRHLKLLQGTRIALLGLAFKPGTDDLRDAPALDIAEWLLAAGATVVATDPMVDALPALPNVSVVRDPYEAARRADAVVLATEWPEYLALDLVRLRGVMRGDLLLDGRNFFEPSAAVNAGFTYEAIGRRGQPMRKEVIAWSGYVSTANSSPSVANGSRSVA